MNIKQLRTVAATAIATAFVPVAGASTQYAISLTKSYTALNNTAGGTESFTYTGGLESLLYVDGGYPRLQIGSVHLPNQGELRKSLGANDIEYKSFDINYGSSDSADLLPYLTSYLTYGGLRLDGVVDVYESSAPKTGTAIAFTGGFPTNITFPALVKGSSVTAPISITLTPGLVSSTTTNTTKLPKTDDVPTPAGWSTSGPGGAISASVSGLSFTPLAVSAEGIDTVVLTGDIWGGAKDYTDLYITVSGADGVAAMGSIGTKFGSGSVTYYATAPGSGSLTLNMTGLSLRAVAPVHINNTSAYVLDFSVDGGSITSSI